MPPMLRDKQVPVITGVNMGIAWNNDCALFLLSNVLGREIITLLEDDTQPNSEAEWITGAVTAQRSAFSLTFGARLLNRA
jgi:hypothetical protein